MHAWITALLNLLGMGASDAGNTAPTTTSPDVLDFTLRIRTAHAFTSTIRTQHDFTL